MANSYEVIERNAIVTGATRGIGRATARLLASNGARVIIHGHDQEECDKVASGIEGTVGMSADLTVESERTALCERAATHFDGKIHILVHNAGIYPEGTLEDETLERWRHVNSLNLESNFHLTKLLLPCLKQAEGASVVLLSSVVTKLGLGNSPSYTTSKMGQIGLMRQLAAELGKDHIRVNAVLPGMVDTEGSRSMTDDAVYDHFAGSLQMVPVYIQAEDLAETIVFLCTPAARAITGACFDVNGGVRV
jgi:NAD(P)-dependent dehydrogenase (short-subunit alcohol dehydrogenase family)